MVMAEGVCVVRQARRALYRHWLLADGEAPPVRGLLARAARLVVEITLGRGEPAHLTALDEVAFDLSRRDWRPPGRWAVPCATTATSGNAMSSASPARKGSA